MHLNEEEKISLGDYGVFLFSGNVDDEKCAGLVEFLLLANLDKKNKHVTVVVNSPGGYVSDGFSVIDVMNGSKVPVRTVGLGIIASMGLLIFIAGQKGHRVLTPNTLIMSHQWAGGQYGKEHELVASAKGNSLISDMFLRHYRKHTGLSVQKIKKYLLPPNDVYLSAKEAKELGLCDEVRLSY